MHQPSTALTRRTLLGMLSSLAVRSRLAAELGKPEPAKAPDRVLLGTSGKVSRGIYTAAWDDRTGRLGPIEIAAEVASPTFLAIRRKGSITFVFAVSETGGDGAVVTAFRLNPDGKTLDRINAQPTEGADPTHVSLSREGGVLAVANYSGGSVTSYRVAADGTLSPPVSHFQYSGKGPNASRQAAPHAHSAQFSPDGRFLLVNDLGLDRINVYAVNEATGELTPAAIPYWTARPGTGPRHIAFHPNGHFVYSVNELDSTIDILAWNAATGELRPLNHVSTLDEGFTPGTAFAGEIVLSLDGRFLYVGNRIAAQTIAVFAVGDGGGSLRLIQLASNGGKTTRHIALDPAGPWVLLSNQGSGAVVVLRRTPDGKLSAPVASYPLDTAMFAGFLPV